jgi:hypothetical protein
LTADAVKVTEVPEQTVVADANTETLTGRTGLTVIVTVPDIAGLPAAQVAFEESSHAIKSLFAGIYANTALFGPAFDPLIFHWYEGAAPPFMAFDVKVTDVPAQTGFADAAIETLTGRTGLTVIVTVPEVAGLPEAQVAFEVNTQVMTSLFAGI